MNLLLVLFLVPLFFQYSEAVASLSFGNNTLQSPFVTLQAVNDEFGRLVQTVTWTFQAAQCEVLTRTDVSISSRAILISLTSSCINRNVCGVRGPITTSINCDVFMRRFN